MAADDHLSPGQFYHGTIHNLKPGDMVEPGHPSNFDELGEPSRQVWASSSKGVAYSYAYDVHDIRKRDNIRPYGRPRVYEVEGEHLEHDPHPVYKGDMVSYHPLRVVRHVPEKEITMDDIYDREVAE